MYRRYKKESVVEVLRPPTSPVTATSRQMKSWISRRHVQNGGDCFPRRRARSVVTVDVRLHTCVNVLWQLVWRASDGRRVTFMLPSAEPVTKKSSKASSARALMAESWAWKVWSSCLWRMSNTHTNPFLPPVISSCCFGAYCSTVAPFSWQGNAAGWWEGGREAHE